MNNVIETLTNLLTSWGSRDIPLPDLSAYPWFPTALLIVTALFGLIYCFFGFKLMRFLSTLVGFLIGITVGQIVQQNAQFAPPLDLIVPIAAGVLFAILGFFLFRIGIFFVVLLGVFSIVMSLLTEYTKLDATVVAIVAIVIAVILSVLSVVYLRPMVIISTALSGGMTFANELFENVVHIRWDAQIETIVRLGVGLLLALIGMIYQFRTTRHMKED